MNRLVLKGDMILSNNIYVANRKLIKDIINHF